MAANMPNVSTLGSCLDNFTANLVLTVKCAVK